MAVLDKAPLEVQPMSKCGSAVKTITIYDKENLVLRPHLRKYQNVEAQVSTHKLKDTTYQAVQELTDDINDRAPSHDPSCPHVSFQSHLNFTDWSFISKDHAQQVL